MIHFTNPLGDRGVSYALLFPLTVIGTGGVAEISFRFGETPFLELKK